MSHIWSKEYDDKLRQRIAELEARNDDTLAKLLERERLNIILQKKNEELEAERDKLRGTLQEILDEHDSWFIHEAARKALKEQT